MRAALPACYARLVELAKEHGAAVVASLEEVSAPEENKEDI